MPWRPSFSVPTSYSNLHLLLAFASGATLALIAYELHESQDYHFRSHLPSIFLNDEAGSLVPNLSKNRRKSRINTSSTIDNDFVRPAGEGLQSAIGNTPLILLPHLSALTKCNIYAKLELLNPGGSPKDRIALSILNHLSAPDPERPDRPVLQAGDTIYEGTVGSTGISLATLCRSRGLLAHIFMPSDQSREKGELLMRLGAKVTKVEPAPIIDQEHYINVARRMARVQTEEFERGVEVEDVDESGAVVKRKKWAGRGWFADQFESEANWRAHYTGTGPEMLKQMEGEGGMDAFVAGAGTGGTISGVGMYLKEKLGEKKVKVVLADPQGSGLYNKVKNGVFWSEYEREGKRRRSQVDSVIEGIGLVRSTRNWEVGEEWKEGVVDEAVKVTDQMARSMARWLVEEEGIWVGGSSAVNCKSIIRISSMRRRGWDPRILKLMLTMACNVGVAALKTALEMGPGHRIVTIFCDSGTRHLSKFWAQIGEIGGEAKVEVDDILQAREVR